MNSLAEILGVSRSELDYLARNITDNVRKTSKDKKDGGKRVVYSPTRRLREIQSKINKLILQKISLPDQLHGSVPGKSTKTYVKDHINKKYVFTLDLINFYPNVYYLEVMNIFLDAGFNRQDSKLLTRLTTIDGYLAPGFPTSPALANLRLKKVVPRLVGLCEKHNLQFGMYQDDLVVSGNISPKKFMGLIRRIFSQEGLALHRNGKKFRFMKDTEQQIVVGYVVNRKINVSKDEYRNLRAEIHACEMHGIDNQRGQMSQKKYIQHILGRINRVTEVNPNRGNQLLQKFNNCIDTYGLD